MEDIEETFLPWLLEGVATQVPSEDTTLCRMTGVTLHNLSRAPERSPSARSPRFPSSA